MTRNESKKSEVNKKQLITINRYSMYKTKYQYGYLPKINYWLGKLAEAHKNGNIEQAIRAEHKVEYFQQRQAEVYG